MAYATVRPRPVPLPTSFVVKNGSKIFGCSSSGIPGPSSLISRTTDSCSASCQRAHDEHAAAVGREHRLLGVDDQVEQHLLHLVPVGEDLRQPGRQRVDDRDVRDALLVGAQRQRLAHDLVHVHHRARRLPLAREGQQVADDARGALGLAEDRLEAAADRRFERARSRQPLGPAQDRGERVVQLVRDAGNRLAERRHLLGLQQLVIDVARLVVQLLALADVADERFDAHGCRRPAGAVGAAGHLDPDGASVGAPEPQQIVGDGAVGRRAAR